MSVGDVVEGATFGFVVTGPAVGLVGDGVGKAVGLKVSPSTVGFAVTGAIVGLMKPTGRVGLKIGAMVGGCVECRADTLTMGYLDCRFEGTYGCWLAGSSAPPADHSGPGRSRQSASSAATTKSVVAMALASILGSLFL